MRTSKISKKILFATSRIALIIAIVLILDVVNFIFYSASGSCHEMVTSYRSQENIDTIFVGPSYCRQGIDPRVVDQVAGTNSFNMGTDSQPMTVSYDLIRRACKEHTISTVVLVTGYDFFNRDIITTPAEITYDHEITAGQGLPDKISTAFRFVTSSDHFGNMESINYIFPWIYNRVDLNISSISENINNKFFPSTDYFSLKGYGNASGTANFNDYSVTKQTLLSSCNSTSLDSWGFEQLDAICKICKENGVQLLVVNLPFPAFNVLSFGIDDYYSNYLEIKGFLSDRGVNYFDFNFAKPSLFDNQDPYYVDSQHLNQKGATAFSTALSKVIISLNNGGQSDALNGYFYDKEEYLASIKEISAVDFNYQVEGNDLRVDAAAYAGTAVTAEYMFQVLQNDGSYTTIQDYSESASALIPIKGWDKITVRVYARIRNSFSKSGRYCEKQIDP